MTTNRIPSKEQLELARRAKLDSWQRKNYGGQDYGREDLGGARPFAGPATVDNPEYVGATGIKYSAENRADLGDPRCQLQADPGDENDWTDWKPSDLEVDDVGDLFDRADDSLADARDGYDTYSRVIDEGRKLETAEEFESISAFINFIVAQGWNLDGHSQRKVYDGAAALWEVWLVENKPVIAKHLGLTARSTEVEDLNGRSFPVGDGVSIARDGTFRTGRGPFSDPVAELTRSGTEKISIGLGKGQGEAGYESPQAIERRKVWEAEAAERRKLYAADAPKGSNPKDRLGSKKLSLGYLPGPGMVYAALGMMNGGIKYDAYNWRENEVLFSVYIDAMERHLTLLKDGEWIDPQSGIPHLSHLLANGFIIADAKETGCLIDDSPSRGVTNRLLNEWNEKLTKGGLIDNWKAERAAREAKNNS